MKEKRNLDIAPFSFHMPGQHNTKEQGTELGQANEIGNGRSYPDSKVLMHACQSEATSHKRKKK